MTGVSIPSNGAAEAGASGLADSSPPRPPHPWRLLLLVIPLGLQVACIAGPLDYAITQRHLSSSVFAGLIALQIVPQSWKFLWAPVVDTTFTRRGWHIAGVLATGTCNWLVARTADDATPSLSMLTVWFVGASFASSFVSMSVASLMAGVVPDAWRGRVAGLYRAGILGATGLGGALAAWLMQSAHWSASVTALALFAISALCCFAWRGMPDLQTEDARGHWIDRAENVFWDLWTVLFSRKGYMAMILCLLPIGTGVATTQWGLAATDWHANADTAALLNSAIFGVVAPVGCLAGGWLCDRLDRKASYCLFGFAQTLVVVALVCSPRTPSQFVFWTAAYSFTQGLTYAGFGAFVLEAIGRTNAATKYSLLASLGNMQIVYATFVSGLATQAWGVNGMLLTDATLALAGIAVFIVIARLTRPRHSSQTPGDHRIASV